MSIVLLAADSALGGAPWLGGILGGLVAALVGAWLGDRRKEKAEREKELRSAVVGKSLELLAVCAKAEEWWSELGDAKELWNRTHDDYDGYRNLREQSRPLVDELRRAETGLEHHAPDSIIGAAKGLLEAAQALLNAILGSTKNGTAGETHEALRKKREELMDAVRAYQGLDPLPRNAERG